jgi:hypothetical protein
MISQQELLANTSLPPVTYTPCISVNFPAAGRYLLLAKGQVINSTAGSNPQNNTSARSWSRFLTGATSHEFSIRSNYRYSLNYTSYHKIVDIPAANTTVRFDGNWAEYAAVGLGGVLTGTSGIMLRSGGAQSGMGNALPPGSTAIQSKMIFLPLQVSESSYHSMPASPTALTPEVYTDYTTLTIPSTGNWWVIGSVQGHRLAQLGGGEAPFMQAFHCIDRGVYSHWLEDIGWEKVTGVLGNLVSGPVVRWWATRPFQAEIGERISMAVSTGTVGGQAFGGDIQAIKPVTIKTARFDTVLNSAGCPGEPLPAGTWVNGPSIVLTPGQWVVTGTAHFHVNNIPQFTVVGNCYTDIWDGTTEYDCTAVTVDNRRLNSPHPAVLNTLALIDVPMGQQKTVYLRAMFSANGGELYGVPEYPQVCYQPRCPEIEPITQPYDLLPQDEELARYGTHITAFQMSPEIPIIEIKYPGIARVPRVGTIQEWFVRTTP